MINPKFPIARKNDLVTQEVPDELLVYDLVNNKAHCLNQTAAAVWRSCDGTKSVSDLAQIVSTESGQTVNDDFVWLAIDQLAASELLENDVRSANYGQSRRDVIKKIGLASVIGLPLIVSLIAPQNALAATSCACVNPIDCSSGPNAGCPIGNCNGVGRCAP